MGDQLMGFPTPAEVFGESKKNKSRKPPPIGSGYASPVGSPQFQHQPHQRSSSSSVPMNQNYYPPNAVPQQQQQVPQNRQYQQAPMPQVHQQQQYRPPQHQQPVRQSSQPSLHSVYSNHSTPSLPLRSSVGQAIPQQQRNSAPQVFAPRSKREIFDSLDRDRSGALSFQELANGLQNRDGSKFALKASSSIFGLFDTDDSQTLSFNEFARLFDCLDRWKQCFLMADKNASDSLSFSEFQDALQVLGYRLSTDTALYVFQTFCKANLDLRFDMFIEACVYLIGITRVFKKFDPQGNGVAVIQFENFVEEVLKLKTKH